jgi:hypothetical protein
MNCHLFTCLSSLSRLFFSIEKPVERNYKAIQHVNILWRPRDCTYMARFTPNRRMYSVSIVERERESHRGTAQRRSMQKGRPTTKTKLEGEDQRSVKITILSVCRGKSLVKRKGRCLFLGESHRLYYM